MKAQVTGRRGALEKALERAKGFNDHWKDLIDWLADAERRAYTDWKPCALPETCQAEITKHQVRQSAKSAISRPSPTPGSPHAKKF